MVPVWQLITGLTDRIEGEQTGNTSSDINTDLSLSVAASAVRLVGGMMLPPGATPEEQAEQGPAWICAVFLAGLFHHLDWLSQIEGSLANGKAWCPGMEIPGANWRVRPRLGRTASMNGMFIASKLIPDAAAIWLQRWTTISGALFLYLSGQKAQSGILTASSAMRLAALPLNQEPFLVQQAPLKAIR